MARAFAAELGRHEIRVNSLHPGAVAWLASDQSRFVTASEVSVDLGVAHC